MGNDTTKIIKHSPLKDIHKNAVSALTLVRNTHMNPIEANKLEEHIQTIIDITVLLIEESHG